MSTESIAYVGRQGNTTSKSLYNPSGFVVFAPIGTKTFRDMKGAATWAIKKGYKPILTQPLKPGRRDDMVKKAFDAVVEEARQEVAQAAAKLVDEEAEAIPDTQPLRVGAKVKDGSTLTL